jgi:hypothetical protein
MIPAKCIVPKEYAKLAWPNRFQTIPQVGDVVRSLPVAELKWSKGFETPPDETGSVELRVVKVAHVGSKQEPYTIEAEVELVLGPLTITG